MMDQPGLPIYAGFELLMWDTPGLEMEAWLGYGETSGHGCDVLRTYPPQDSGLVISLPHSAFMINPFVI